LFAFFERKTNLRILKSGCVIFLKTYKRKRFRRNILLEINLFFGRWVRDTRKIFNYIAEQSNIKT